MAQPSVFSRRLKEARKASGFSQRSLGIAAGLDPFVASARINRYEMGVHLPDIATAQRLADALKVPLPYLFADNDGLAGVILQFGEACLSKRAD